VPEIVGAWLHVWTPPRDVDVPPVPWRKFGIATAILAVVCAGAAAAIVPAIDRGKERRAAQERAQTAAERAAARRRIVHDQRPRFGRAASRAGMLAAVERAISRDAAARMRAGELKGPIGATQCQPATYARPRPGQGVFDCLTAVRTIPATGNNPSGTIGYPFRAVLDYRKLSYAWCKTDPSPGEQLIPDPRTVVELPPACRGR